MAADADRSLIDRLVRGADGTIRATYRVVLAVVAFLVALLLGRVLVGVAGVGVSLVVVAAVNVVSLVVMAALFSLVAGRLDARPLAAYGIARPGRAAGQFLAGFVATLVGFGLWFGLWIAAGRMTADVVLSYAGGSLAVGVLFAVVATVAGAAVQDLAFLGLLFTNAVSGLQARVGDRTVAGVGGVVVTTAAFLGYHFLLGAGAAAFLPPVQAAVSLGAGLAYFLGVYVYTGSLTAAIGAHGAVNFSGVLYGWTALDPPIPYAVPEVFVVRGSTPLTEVVGPTPLVAFVFGGVLLAIATRTPVVETTAASVPLRE